jgi:hypothetical protein
MSKQQSSEEQLEIFTVKQLAKYMHISIAWIYANLDDIPHTRLPGKKGRRMIRFEKDAIKTFMSNNLTHLQREE